MSDEIYTLTESSNNELSDNVKNNKIGQQEIQEDNLPNLTEREVDLCEDNKENLLLSDEAKLNTNKEEETPPEVEEILSEDVKNQNHEEALAFKETGNQLFKEANYQLAVEKYANGIKICPKSFSKTMSILYSNRAACLIKLDEKDQAILDCTTALEHDEYYTKARLRRAQIYEATEKLDEALKDYNDILKYDKSCQAAGEAAMRLPGQINERNEKLKEEMVGKLKELGNMCLKPFGLSTENFKFNQDPNTGGYSVNFQR